MRAFGGLGIVMGVATSFMAGSAIGQTPEIKRIILSSSGMAQIEREADVDGSATIGLAVPLDQVDDVMKSLTVFDAKGQVEAVRLTGKEPLAQTLRSMPFSAADLGAPDKLLNALKGAEVTVNGSRVIRGRIMSVTAETAQTGPSRSEIRHRLTILTDGGLESLVLEDAQQISFADPAIKAALDKALAASLDSRAQEQRTIAIGLTGEGNRQVTLSYVVAAPIWKTSYRILLPKTETKAVLQGWVILENMTGSDWNKIDLTIMSGNPVTLHQALYESYYVRRPEVPVQVFGQLRPRMDAEASYAAASAGVPVMAAPPPAPAPAPAPMGMLMRKAQIAQSAQAMATADAGAQVYFHFPHAVSVASGQSLMVPFIDREVPVEKLWLYQPDTDATHPLAAFRLRNDGPSSLPAGIMTVYDGDGSQFTGDAQFPNLPHGDNRLISYALDQKTTISRDEQSDDTLIAVTADRGVLHVKRQTVAETIYTVKAPADEARTLIVEQPKREGFALQDAQGVEETPSLYRFRMHLHPGEKQVLHVRLIQPQQDDTQIVDMDDDMFKAAIAWSQQVKNPNALAALRKIADQRRKLADVRALIGKLDDESARIAKDQERLRANLASVPKDGDLARRYIAALEDQENRLAQIAQERDSQAKAQSAAESDLNGTIAGASF